MNRLAHTLLRLTLCGLVACTGQKTAGGGGIWDQTENGVALTVVDSTGAPVPNARVRFVGIADWPSKVLNDQSTNIDSALTNKNGQALLHTNSWPVNLEVQSQWGVKRMQIFAADSALLLALEKPSQLTGTLNLHGETAPSEILLAGSTYRAALSPTGAFSFAAIPAGTYSLVAQKATAISLLAPVSISKGDSTTLSSLFLPNSSTVLLEDFEDSTDANRYHNLTSQGMWYTYTDSISQVIPSDIQAGIVSGSEAWQGGRSLHESLAVNISILGKFALCAMNIDDGTGGTDVNRIFHNLLGMDSLTFMAKGSGNIYVQISTLYDNSLKQVMAVVNLSSAWTQVSLQPADFLPTNADSTVTWNSVAAKAINISFIAMEPADLWLDEIELHGISESQLFPQLSKP